MYHFLSVKSLHHTQPPLRAFQCANFNVTFKIKAASLCAIITKWGLSQEQKKTVSFIDDVIYIIGEPDVLFLVNILLIKINKMFQRYLNLKQK